ncbi:hypothetical protein HDU91_003869, partial [Kappamyces sp. JEL0680]
MVAAVAKTQNDAICNVLLHDALRAGAKLDKTALVMLDTLDVDPVLAATVCLRSAHPIPSRILGSVDMSRLVEQSGASEYRVLAVV